MTNEATALGQDEIDALFRAAQKQSEATPIAEKKKARIFRCIFGPSSRITKQQMHLVRVLHDTFTRNVAARLGARLRTALEARLVGVEELAYGKFLNRIPKLTYWASVRLQPFNAKAVLNLDLSLAFPMIDLLLGGDGATEPVARCMTEIEEHIIEMVGASVCHGLEATWQPVLDLQFVFDRHQDQTTILRVIPADEKILALSFELGLLSVRGMLNIAFPGAVTNALLRKISEQWLSNKRRAPEESRAFLRERLKQCQFCAEVVLPNSLVDGHALLALKAGQILVLNNLARDPALIRIAGRTLFTGNPVRVGKARGLRLIQRFSRVADTEKEFS